MSDILIAITLISSVLLSIGVIVYLHFSNKKVLNKFNSLPFYVKEKLLLIEYYMTFVRFFTDDELEKIAKLSEEEILSFNKIKDLSEKIKIVKEKIN